MSKSVNLSKNKREDSVARKSTKDALSLDAIEVDSKAGSFSMNTTGKVISSKKPSGTGKSSGGSSGWNFSGLASGNISCENYTVDSNFSGLNINIKDITKIKYYEISFPPTSNNTLDDLGDEFYNIAKIENDDTLTDAERDIGKVNYGVFYSSESYDWILEMKGDKCSMCGKVAMRFTTDPKLSFDLSIKLPKWNEINQASSEAISSVNEWSEKLKKHEEQHQIDYDSNVLKKMKIFKIKAECCWVANKRVYENWSKNPSEADVLILYNESCKLVEQKLKNCIMEYEKSVTNFHSCDSSVINKINGFSNLK